MKTKLLVAIYVSSLHGHVIKLLIAIIIFYHPQVVVVPMIVTLIKVHVHVSTGGQYDAI